MKFKKKPKVNKKNLISSNIIGIRLLDLIMIIAAIDFIGIDFGLIDYAYSLPLASHCLLMSILMRICNQKIQSKKQTMAFWQNQRATLFPLMLWTFSILNGFLALSWLPDFNIEKAWMILFAAPAILMWKSMDHTKTDILIVDQENSDKTENSPNAIYGFILSILPFSLYWLSLMVLIAFGFSYFEFFHTVFIDETILSINDLLPEFIQQSTKLIPIGISVIIVISLMLIIIKLLDFLPNKKRSSQNKNANRKLSDAELEFGDQCLDELRDYLKLRQFSLFIRAAHWIVQLGFIPAMFAYILAIDFNAGVGSGIFKADRVEGLDWYLYNDFIGATEAIGFFVVFVGYFSLAYVLTNAWPELREFNTIKSKTVHAENDDKMDYFANHLAMDIKRYKLNNDQSFDPQDYIRSLDKNHSMILYKITAYLLVLTSVFYVLDRRDYDLYTPDHIEYTDYWTGSVHSVDYSGVTSIEVSCALDGDNFNLEYILIMPDETKLSIVDQKVTDSNLDEWEKIDAIITAYGTPKEPSVTSEEESTSFNAQQCHDVLRKRHGSTVAKRIMKVMGE